jgi:hypothetical protein
VRSRYNDILLRVECSSAKEHALYDARLTEKGIQQARSLKAHLVQRPSGSRSFTAFDLLVKGIHGSDQVKTVRIRQSWQRMK